MILSPCQFGNLVIKNLPLCLLRMGWRGLVLSYCGLFFCCADSYMTLFIWKQEKRRKKDGCFSWMELLTKYTATTIFLAAQNTT